MRLQSLLRCLGAWTFAENASASVLFVASLPMFLLIAGLAMDSGGAYSEQAVLKDTANSAALAAAMQLVTSPSTVVATAQTYAEDNLPVATNGTVLKASDVQTGNWNATTRTFTNNGIPVNAVRVLVQRSAANGNPFPTSFLNLLGQSTWNVSASAIAALTNPNIDFYFMLDSSPSMAIAATQAGINTMVAATPAQAGCAFGCHESDPSGDNLGNPGCVNNVQKPACEDNYALARSLGVTLRIDLINQAVQNLMTTAQSAETTYKANYRMALYNFDTTNHTLQALTSNLATAQASAANLALLEVYTQSCVTTCPPQSGNNNDEDTNLDGAMSFINTTMPNAGFGSSIPSDSPQEVLFLITDGVEDYVNNGNRYIATINTAFCDSIKARGIRIAVLYTAYLPLPTNAFYNQNVAPFQSNIQPTLQSCATPGLFQTVQVGGSINSALSGLFATALETAQLVQ